MEVSASMEFGGAKITLSADVGNDDDILMLPAKLNELFNPNEECASCASKKGHTISYRTDNGGNVYFDRVCPCGYTLGYGKRRIDGARYPRRINGLTGEVIGTNGWYNWQKEQETSED